MKIIFVEDVPALGKMGELVKVSGGYGRNFLIPYGKAIKATTQNMKIFEHQTQQLKEKLIRLKGKLRNWPTELKQFPVL